MKYFQKIITYLVVLTMNLVFIQTDLLSQNDSLIKNDSLIIGGLFKVTLITGEETVSELQSYDSTYIKLMSKGSLIRVKRSSIKSVEEYTYILSLGMGKKDNEKVTVILKDGTFYRGRLLSVLLIRKYELNEKDDTRIKNNILEIKRDKIFRVLIHGNSNVLSGLGYGALIGAGLGGVSGFADGDEPSGFIRLTAEAKAILLGITLGLVGGVVGLTVGLISSTPDEIIEIDSDDDFYLLNKYAEFSFGELPIHKNQKKKNSK